MADPSEPQLLRETYQSDVMNAERDYFVYLPVNFAAQDSWPVILFLHGDGERGDARDELDYVLHHGPLYEAWVQRRELPFVIVAPQLDLFGMHETVGYIRDRDPASIP